MVAVCAVTTPLISELVIVTAMVRSTLRRETLDSLRRLTIPLDTFANLDLNPDTAPTVTTSAGNVVYLSIV